MAKNRQPNGAGTIRKRKDGTFEAMMTVYDHDGKSKRKSFYGKNKQEVFDKMEEFKISLAIKESNISVRLEDYLNEWLYSVKKLSIKPASFDRLEMTIENQIIPRLGNYYMNELTSMIIQVKLINDMMNKGQSLSSIKKAFYAVRASCEYAIGEHLDNNPCKKVILPSRHNFTSKEIAVLSDINEYDESDNVIPCELERFKSVALSKFPHKDQYIFKYGYSFILMLNTGMRTGEMLALKWSDVDFDKQEIKVSKNMVEVINRDNDGLSKLKQIEQNSVKTKASNRTIPLNKTAVDALFNLKQINFSGNNGYVIENSAGKPINKRNYLRSYKSILERAGIKDSGLHTLRHTFATQLFKKGVDVKVVSKILGHADVNTTYNVYIHVIEEQLSDALLLIDDI